MLALMIAEGPIVATFHTSTTKSLTLSVFQGILRPLAREDRRPHRGVRPGAALADGGARLRCRARSPTASTSRRSRRRRCWTAIRGRARSVLFLGRFDEPRKGMAVLLGALPALVEAFPDVEILVVGRGDEDELREEAGELAGHLRFLGQVDDADEGLGDAQRRRVLRARTPAARASASCWSRRWPRAPRWWPATSTPSGGCSRTVRRAGWCRSTTPRRWPTALIEVLPTTRRAQRYVDGGRRGGAPLRLVGGGRADHAGVRDGRRCRA